MTIRLRVHVLQIAIACVVGLLVAWVRIARGDEVPRDVPQLVLDMPAEVVMATPTPATDVTSLVTSLGVAVFVIGAAVRALRGAFVEQLAPVPSTTRSKQLVLGVACAIGVVLGLLGVAPAVGAGTAGKVVGGLLAAFVTYGGAGVLSARARGDTVGKLGRVHREAITREQARAAGLTTGQMRVLAIGEETPGPGTPPPEV